MLVMLVMLHCLEILTDNPFLLLSLWVVTKREREGKRAIRVKVVHACYVILEILVMLHCLEILTDNPSLLLPLWAVTKRGKRREKS